MTVAVRLSLDGAFKHTHPSLTVYLLSLLLFPDIVRSEQPNSTRCDTDNTVREANEAVRVHMSRSRNPPPRGQGAARAKQVTTVMNGAAP
ncbi:Hypothetical protein SMAX5B_007301 [Scophthalmus maximus]|uniref:Secreted protein n=1 Tax=Scophthalmus maximus TaxID=52904 RepID=A0A2U9BR25_SCOMX|nr:Hypothetical protein SMAX5B_007301 [Scophthalmus maximus]